MKQKYKLFGIEIEITLEQRLKYNGHLRSWNTLHKYLSGESYSEDDLMKLIILERERKVPRHSIVSRLHSAHTTMKRKAQQHELGIRD